MALLTHSQTLGKTHGTLPDIYETRVTLTHLGNTRGTLLRALNLRVSFTYVLYDLPSLSFSRVLYTIRGIHGIR